MPKKDANRSRYGNIILALICFVLQLALAPNLTLGAGRFNFALIYAFCIAFLIGGRRAVIHGFMAGLIFDLATTGPFGLMTLLLCVMSYLLGLEGRNRFADGLGAALSSFAVSSFAVILIYHLTMLALGDASSLADVLIWRVLPSFALSFVAFCIFAWYFARDAAAGVSARPKRGSHYSMKGL
ncbi:MAG: rod shape-determining protein MreD [Atopobiaceae bacterium]|jgi:rod shape-determining protein MreD